MVTRVGVQGKVKKLLWDKRVHHLPSNLTATINEHSKQWTWTTKTDSPTIRDGRTCQISDGQPHIVNEFC